MKHLIIISISILLFSCKNEKATPVSAVDLNSTNIQGAKPSDPSTLTLPEACDMLSTEDLKSIFSVPAAAFKVKKANDPNDEQSRSCFFQWEDPSTPNAGIMLNVKTNSLHDEAPDFFTRSIEAKMSSGETVLGQDKANKFVRFNAGGEKGVFSFQNGYAYWAKGNDYMFWLAFNVSTLSESKMKEAAEEIATKVNANFASKVK